MRTVCIKMSTFLVSALFLVMVLGITSAEKHRNRETSTTFLRLTALRSDEGLWIAKFGDYEISIELKHHPGPTKHADYNDTWTLKVKHTPMRFTLPVEQVESMANEVHGEITQEPSFQTSESKGSWKQLIDAIDDNDEDDSTVFKKINPSTTKSKKAKARRQLSTKSFTSTTEKSDSILGETAHGYSNDPIVMKELAQGSNRLNVVFDNEQRHNKPMDKFDVEYEEVNEKPWRNIAAIIYDGKPINSAVINNDTDKDTDNSNTPLVERLTDSYALPLQQSLQTNEYDEVQDISLGQDIANPQNFNPDTWVVPEDVIVDEHSEQTSKTSSEEITNTSEGILSTTEPQDTSIENFSPEASQIPEDSTVEGNHETRKDSEETENDTNEQTIENEDYVVEDLSDRKYGKNDYEDEGSETESSEVDFSELEVPPEMKRIMEWYPRSKPLTIENNGYKLYPGVGWFKFVPWAERWSNARKVCESEMAHLAIPDSKQKVRIFLQIFKYYPDVLEQSILSNQAYVGVYNRGLHRNLTTVLDKPFQPRFPIWFPGEPDNADPGEDCVTFHAEGKIRDVPCFYNLPFLCEKEPDIS